MNKQRKLIRGELIGLVIEVPSDGLKGKIIDETKNTIIIDVNGKKKTIIKNKEIKFKDQKITINSEKLRVKPEERIKLR
jgi:RNase P/RNase MRP subunit p29